ncbi:hypothetical protein M422DRAFT_253877 [Sphaerobolus stellatus SS14]|uniref:Uncharacterized protein n=1 Tax=Sphaerobolus stellatus (strain SS14) TaxID=990650 RepID=A0A0C9V730_SPHS4|nr:hypothetical protein M422DRAFT_253877 [Sphaerobolus stellatus SS14]
MPAATKAKPVRLRVATATKGAAKAASKNMKEATYKANKLQVLRDRNNNAMTPQGRKMLGHSSSSPSINSSERDDEIEALKVKIARLKAQKAKKTMDNEPKVPKPPGEAGREFNLQEEMLLGNKNVQWNAIKATVRDLIHEAGMRRGITYRNQPKEKVAGVLVAARKAQPYLKRFIDDWATIAIMKQALHNFKHNPLRSHQVNTSNNSDDEDGAGEEEEPLDEEEDSDAEEPTA